MTPEIFNGQPLPDDVEPAQTIDYGQALKLAQHTYETDPAFRQLIYPGPCDYCKGDGISGSGGPCYHCDGDGHARQYKPDWEHLDPRTRQLFIHEAVRKLTEQDPPNYTGKE